MLSYKKTVVFWGLFLCSLLQLQAQSAAMQAQRQTAQFQQFAMQSARTAHQQHQMFQNMHLMRNSMYGRPKPNAGGKYKFHVVTLGGDTIHAKRKIKIYFDEPIKKLELKTKSGEEIFSPKETKEIFITKGKHTIKGIPYSFVVDTIKLKNRIEKKNVDETAFGSKSTLDFLADKQKQTAKEEASRNIYWIFKIYSAGNLSLYSPFPEYDMAYVTLYQLGNDSIKSLTPEVVAELARGNEKAEKAVSKKKLGKALDILIKEEIKKEKATKEKQD